MDDLKTLTPAQAVAEIHARARDRNGELTAQEWQWLREAHLAAGVPTAALDFIDNARKWANSEAAARLRQPATATFHEKKELQRIWIACRGVAEWLVLLPSEQLSVLFTYSVPDLQE